VDDLAQHLNQDADRLFSILKLAGPWQAENDAKLAELHKLLTKKHRTEKVLVFTQFADTVAYLEEQLRALGAREMAAVTGETEDPSSYARRFSPVSNQAREKITPVEELRILVATDVLSEGQNLQDAAIVVNYDLPWAIIRLIQRAGRVDRIGQRSEKILCYSFLPADGVERLIRLRSRVRQRLHENAEVVGTDETFFEDEKQDQVMRDLFTEKSGILEDPDDTEVDLASQAYQIWKNATDLNPTLKKTIPDLPNVIFSTKPLSAIRSQPERAGAVKPTTGVMVYIRNLRRL
jgi:superfamily II DNA/RNA helicase